MFMEGSMEMERREFEIFRVLNMVKQAGWEELSQLLEREKMTLSVVKDLTGASEVVRRLALDGLESMVKVLGWEMESSSLDGDKAQMSLVKSLVVEVGSKGGPENLEAP